MNFVSKLSTLLTLLCFFVSSHTSRVGLLVTATGKYKVFVPELVKTAQRYFLTEHDVTYFIFTDAVDLPLMENVQIVPTEKRSWPFSSMMRCEIYYKNRNLFDEYDYLYAIDADMRFVDLIGDEILVDLVATAHPLFIGKQGTFETNERSKAFVHENERNSQYVAGAFYGGNSLKFIDLCGRMLSNITADLENSLIAIWHDESHLNRCFIDVPPVKYLTPEYCYPEEFPGSFCPGFGKCNVKLSTVGKNLAYMRS